MVWRHVTCPFQQSCTTLFTASLPGPTMAATGKPGLHGNRAIQQQLSLGANPAYCNQPGDTLSWFPGIFDMSKPKLPAEHGESPSLTLKHRVIGIGFSILIYPDPDDPSTICLTFSSSDTFTDPSATIRLAVVSSLRSL